MKNFIIKNYNRQGNKLILNYSFENKLNFQEKIDFNVDRKIKNFEPNTLDFIFTNILIANWISYYKLFPFAKIILPIKLTENQLNFWKKFYTNGLGEFFFRNRIDPKVIEFVNWEIPFSIKIKKPSVEEKALLLRWGGKDSIVTYSLIKNKLDFDLLVVGKLDPIKLDTAKVVWKNPILVKRQLDPKLFKLNKNPKFYNGHVPITWIISFISLATAYLYWYKYIFTSNEKSAQEENTIRKWVKINHQYSKSKEFEEDFKKYNQSLWIIYKSLLSDYLEIEIAEKFSQLNEFFSYFSSCNKNFKINEKIQTERWCWKCEKCAFVYLILSPFLDEKDLIKIFGKNLFEDPQLLQTYLWLIWKELKPFECVWTHNESKKAFKLVIEKYKKENKELPLILKEIEKLL